MARKRGLAAYRGRKKKAQRPRRNATAMIANPPLARDFTQHILPGFAGYAATKFFSRIAYTLVQKRFPKFGKHAGVIASLAGFGITWFGVNRIKRLEGYATPAIVGAGIAAVQTAFTTYVPKYGWVVADFHPTDVMVPQKPVLEQTPGSTGQYMSVADQLEAEAEAMADAAIGDADLVSESKSAAAVVEDHREDPDMAAVDDDFSDLLGDENEMGTWGPN